MEKLEVRGATKSFGNVNVLRGIDLLVEPGSFVVIVGPSGCGKTTLLRSLAGLEALDHGSIILGNRDLTHLEPRERDVAMVFQNYALYPTKSVFENMAYGLRMRGVARQNIKERVTHASEVLRISHLLDRRPSQLSGGQRQRVAMGRAMVRQPHLFLFDEPLSNLDAALRAELRVEIKRIQRSLGVTTVYVTHDQQEAMTLADLLVVMRDGRIEQMGTPKSLYDRPTTRFVAGFLGTPPMTFLPGHLKNGYLAFDGETSVEFPFLGLAPSHGSIPVDVGVRPEDIRLTKSDAAGAIPARVDLVEELGASRLVHLSSSLGPIIVNFSGDEVPSSGGLGFVLTPERLSLFDQESGRRLVS